jgi:hypothetical protein
VLDQGLAQILAEIELTPKQRSRAITILKRNLVRYEDWIVRNLTIEALAHFARQDQHLRAELIPSFISTNTASAEPSPNARANYWRNSSQRGREGVLVSGAQARADSHRLLLYDPFRRWCREAETSHRRVATWLSEIAPG